MKGMEDNGEKLEVSKGWTVSPTINNSRRYKQKW